MIDIVSTCIVLYNICTIEKKKMDLMEGGLKKFFKNHKDE